MTEHSTGQRLAAAARYLRRALDNDATGDARQGYELVGLAQAELEPGASLAEPPQRELLDDLEPLLTRNLVLAARAAVDVTTPAQFNRGVLASLLARSGYQVLLDARIWPEPPLSEYHLRDVDESLAEALEEAGAIEVPIGIPPTHTWWRR